MCWGWTLVLAVNTLWMCCGSGQRPPGCRCKDPSLCQPLGPDSQSEVEVVVFHDGGQEWKDYDWSKITTFVTSDLYDFELLCISHAHNTRLVFYDEVHKQHLSYSGTLNKWIDKIKSRFMDGINLQLHKDIITTPDLYSMVPEFVQALTEAFHQKIPGSQVSFNVPWSPHCDDERCFDFLAVSRACDILFVASFDIPNDMRDGCVARSSASYHHVLSGISAYIKLGIDSRKLVMGVAWFGYDYTCQRFLGIGSCELENLSQNSISCSHYLATPLSYKTIMYLLARSITGRFWDDEWKAPYFVYLDGKNYHEVWYDDPESISMKSSFLKKLRLRGIGIWTANYLDYSEDIKATMQTEEMWNALCPP